MKQVEDSCCQSSCESYGAFAKIYDEIMDSVPYDYWFDYIEFLWQYHRKNTPQDILELACGTGNMMKRFMERGYSIDGIDKSSAMLAEAEKKLAEGEFSGELYCQDMRKLSLTHNYDFIYSVFDSMNYILSPDDLELVFKGVQEHLSDRGLFIFDFNTRSRLQQIEPGYTDFHGENFDCKWQDIVEKENNTWKVKLTISIDGSERFFHEQHEETSFALSKVNKILQKSGFNFINCFDSTSLRPGKEASNRVYFVASREDFDKHSLFGNLGLKIYWKIIQFKHFIGLN